jgi:hypothetical protein
MAKAGSGRSAASLPGPTPGELAALAAYADDAGEDRDEEAAALLARLACGDDLRSAAALLAWCAAQAAAITARQAEPIRALARALQLREVVSGKQAAAVLQGGGVG